ncbi:MAG: SycD/LcrH family type III secretion system chaperone [Myxococcaceae bacterium]
MAEPQNDQKQLQQLQKWAEGKATLKDVRGYTDEQLYSIARAAYNFYYQGKLEQARTLFQGLYAVNPLNSYFAKALGVVEFAAGNSAGAISAYDVAIKLSPEDAGAYVGRAEIKLAMGQKTEAIADLRKASQSVVTGDPLEAKVSAMLQALNRR